jgi:hypothetical protein
MDKLMSKLTAEIELRKKSMKKGKISEQVRHGKKSLLKFTDFEEVKTLQDFKSLQETAPDKMEEIQNWLQDKLNTALKRETPIENEIEKYFNRVDRCLEAMEVSEAWMKLVKQDRWYVNEQRIKSYIHNTLVTNRYLPTNTEISKATGLSRVTVNKHIKENCLSDYREEARDKYRMLNINAINQLYYLAFQNSDVKALRMFIELTKEAVDNGRVLNTNYIQINNTKIDTVLIDRLPEETRQQIEILILDNLPK